MFGIIYKCTNKVDGKMYIGQTTNRLEHRIRQHFSCKKKYPFYNAIKKYGPDVFDWEVLEACDTKEELNEMEFHYIKQYNSLERGYNLTLGGEGVVGNKISIGTRIKMSEAARKRKTPPFTEEHKHKISIAHIGKKGPPMSQSLKKLFSDINKNKKLSEETKQKISLKNKGVKKSDEAKLKMSIAHLGKKFSDSHKKAIGISNKGHVCSTATRLKISESNKGGKHFDNGYFKKGKDHPYFNKTGVDAVVSKVYVVTFPDNSEYVVVCLKDFCEKFKLEKLNSSRMYLCASGKINNHKKYRCRHYNENSDLNIPKWSGDT